MSNIEIFKKKLVLSELVDEMLNVAQVECPVNHHFADGQYVRETLMPKGSIVIGKKHKHSTVNIMLTGSATLYNEEDETVTTVKAPFIFTSQAGVQKMAYFHEDTIWVNTHPTDETDLEKIEMQFIENNNEELICHG